MKLTIAKAALLDLLNIAKAIVPKEDPRPILEGALFIASPGRLTVKATDLRLSLILDHLTETVEEPGAMCLPVSKLQPVVKELRTDTVHLEVEENAWLTVRSGKARFRIPTTSPDDYPVIEPVTAELTQIPGETFFKILDQTLFSVAGMDRPSMSGICLDSYNGKLRATSTDGHRLSRIVVEGSWSGRTLLPAAACHALRKIASPTQPIHLGVHDGKFIVRSNGMTLLATLPEGLPPNYDQAIPGDAPWMVSLDRAELIGAVRRVAVASDKESRPIKFTAEGASVLLEACNPLMEGTDTIPAEVREKVFFAADARYVLDTLNAAEGATVFIYRAGAMMPVKLWSGPDETFVVMPLADDSV